MADTKWSQFPSAADAYADDEVVGLKNGQNTRFSFARILALIRQNLSNFFVPTSSVGVAGGVASLDRNGKVPSGQLPSGTGPEPATATPLMDGTGAVGVSTKYAREDHEHPSDTNKQNKITANGILKGDGQGGVSAATAGTDYGTYSKPSGGIPASDLANGVIPSVPSAYPSNPAMDGTASPGTSNDYARGDHVHPSDSSKVPMTNPSYGPYTASGGTMDVEYFYKSVGELVYITGFAVPTATVGVTGRSDVTFSDLPKDMDASAPVFMSANNCTVSSSDLRPVLQIAYLGGKGFRFQGQATLNRAFQFSIIYS